MRKFIGFFLVKGLPKKRQKKFARKLLSRSLRHWEKFDPSKGNETSWMLTIAKNQFLDMIKKKDTVEKRELGDSQKVLEIISKKETEYEEDRYQLDLLNASVESLPQLEKNIIVLRFLRKYTIKETADKLGISVRTVNRKTFATLTVLRKKLEALNFDFESI